MAAVQLNKTLVITCNPFILHLSSLGPTVFRGPRKTAEFGFEPRNFTTEFVFFRGIRLFAPEFDVFHSNNYFFTENDLKVALLQVCL